MGQSLRLQDEGKGSATADMIDRGLKVGLGWKL